jgi:hypothetical protein
MSIGRQRLRLFGIVNQDRRKASPWKYPLGIRIFLVESQRFIKSITLAGGLERSNSNQLREVLPVPGMRQRFSSSDLTSVGF